MLTASQIEDAIGVQSHVPGGATPSPSSLTVYTTHPSQPGPIQRGPFELPRELGSVGFAPHRLEPECHRRRSLRLEQFAAAVGMVMQPIPAHRSI